MALLLLPLLALAQDRYVITGSSGSFIAKKGNATVATGAIQSVIEGIRSDVDGADCEIQFGDGTSVLDIGSESIAFFDHYTIPAYEMTPYIWGKIALFGKISSTSESATITIYTYILAYATEIYADITNNYSDGSAIVSFGSLALGGSPNIVGSLGATATMSVITTGDNAFAPGNKQYLLNLDGSADGAVAVTNGKNFIGNFKVAGSDYTLAISGNNLVVKEIPLAYIITGADGLFTAKKDGLQIGTTGTIQTVIDAIKNDSKRKPCEIQFGDGTSPLDIGEDLIEFKNSSFTNSNWGKITLLGKITAEEKYYSGVIRLEGYSGYTEYPIEAESKVDITTTGNSRYAIKIFNSILTISSGTLYAPGKGTSGASIGRTLDVSENSTINITGGTISSTEGNAILASNYNITINISGGKISSTKYAIYNSSERLQINISGGEIDAVGGYIVNITGGTISSVSGNIVLGGSPNITDSISTSDLRITTTGENSFAPGNKIYNIAYSNTYNIGETVVTNGKNFAGNFKLKRNGWELVPDGEDLVMVFPNTPRYIITGSGETFTANKNGGSRVGVANKPIQEVINAIKADTQGDPCEIQFGDLTTELDIGDANISFTNTYYPSNFWGKITLFGKITSSNNTQYSGGTILISGPSVESKADIENTSTGSYAIRNQGAGSLTVSEGNIYATNTAIAYGSLTVTGGTISAMNDVILRPSSLLITGGAIKNLNNGTAIYFQDSECMGDCPEFPIVALGGNPDITGEIKMGYDTKGLLVITNGDNAFAPDVDKIYTLGFFEGDIGYDSPYLIDHNHYVGKIAVSEGKNFLANFELANVFLDLIEDNNDIKMVAIQHYIINSSGTTFTATKNGTTVGTANQPIQDVINSIKSDANGKSCIIQFGNGENELNIGSASILFDDTEAPSWGRITLLGKITGADASAKATISLNMSKSGLVKSIAEIRNTYYHISGSGNSIANNGAGTLIIDGGGVYKTNSRSCLIKNTSTGSVIVRNGTVSATGDWSSAICNSTGNITISGGTVSARDASAIDNFGIVIISGGTLGYIENNGGTMIISGSTLNNINDNNGTITISGGTLNNINDNYGTITISGGTINGNVSNGSIASKASIVLDGNPEIKGYIKTEVGKLSVISSSFAPGDKIYTLNFDENDYVPRGKIAVKNGANFTENFKLEKEAYGLLARNGDLEIQPIVEITISPTENGTAKANVASSKLPAGTQVTLTATADEGYRFIRWVATSYKEIAINNLENPATFEMPDDDVKINAVFAKLYAVTIIVDGGEDAGNNVESNDYYVAGDTVTLTPNAAENWEFIKWSSYVTITNNTFTMPAANVEITATFKFQSGYKYVKNETTYTITKSASENSIQNIISQIKTAATGEDCSIQFDNLNIGTASIEFGGTEWGNITLLGKITSSNASANGAIYLTGNVSLDSKADIAKTNGYAINNKGTGTLTISSGNISAENNAVFNFSSGTIDITGGTISAKTNAVYNASTGIISITGGTISAQEKASAVYNVMGSIVLGSSPSITGYITKLAPISTLSILANFAPGENIYTIDFARYLEGSIAVANGSEFAQNFALANKAWQLTEKNNALIASGQTSPIINKTIALENIPANAKVQIYNIKGKFLYNSQFSTLNSQISKLQAGVYIVKANNQSFKVTVK